MAESSTPSHAFDAVAPRYDASFTDQQLGRWLREVVWREFDNVFQPGDSLLDLGCGTGEDACYLAQCGARLVATDASQGMLDVARQKAERSGLSSQISFAQLDLQDLSQSRIPASLTDSGGPFDGGYSNFGPLNCLPDRRQLSAALGRLIRPGGTFIAVVMGPFCPWESGWYLMHGHLRTTIRRMRSGVRSQVGDGMVSVWYPSSRRLKAEFSPDFVYVKTLGVGVFLPPSDLGHLIPKAPRLFSAANALDERVRATIPSPWI
ncbi:MAG TPA: methyltransferase domain-containing protein, partial [Nitrolancea sp.]|nr:methyltransferase domain-containing protein [Nitrolancea sp.]